MIQFVNPFRKESALARRVAGGALLAVAGLLVSPAVAQPVIAFDDSANASPGAYAQGSSFSLDLLLNAAFDAGGVGFDLEFSKAGSAPGADQITLVSRNNAGSVLSSYNNFDANLGMGAFSGTTGTDLGQFSFAALAPAGNSFLATYVFEVGALAPGEYEIAIGGNTPGIVTDEFFEDVNLGDSSYTFTVLVPEPTTAGLLMVSAGAVLLRRKRIG
ncbi:PEP-CTERM sorting domain-containing protein [Algisphaera agarilytica]|uniref:PEP-CTERM protein-sorting domain-containing protein n=1 Tax=Algisphaera agarilytica TaxID=1385975 RepID=A0A7X0H580_9BACT|nr:PEP-CTERM sorting domain-containing protein [Algisphaera agarilytica]MBB6429521.1 hypothetical protein [Algisphaera agarilytica]